VKRVQLCTGSRGTESETSGQEAAWEEVERARKRKRLRDRGEKQRERKRKKEKEIDKGSAPERKGLCLGHNVHSHFNTLLAFLFTTQRHEDT
jgi:hypothetical protein